MKILGRRSSQRREEPDYLFVMTYGRSGSTLLMGLLNSIPGYLIRGENRHALRHLYDFHTSGLRERDRVKPRKAAQQTHPWFGIQDFDAEASLAHTRALVRDTLLRPTADTRVTGFKEVRWYDDDLAEYVAWLREVFPGCRFVVNTRDHAGVAASGWWQAAADPLGALAEIEERMLRVAEGLGPAAHRVHYDDYAHDVGHLRGLFDWLGEPFDEARLREILAVEHSVANTRSRKG